MIAFYIEYRGVSATEIYKEYGICTKDDVVEAEIAIEQHYHPFKILKLETTHYFTGKSVYTTDNPNTLADLESAIINMGG